MNTPTWNNMTFSEKERHSYLNGLPCAESRGELLDHQDLFSDARRHLEQALDFIKESDGEGNGDSEIINSIENALWCLS